jgi:hypothetical protein
VSAKGGKERKPLPVIATALACGLLSAACLKLPFLFIFSLVPVHYAYSRRGRGGGWMASLTAVIATFAADVALSGEIGMATLSGGFIAGILHAALALFNAKPLDRSHFALRLSGIALVSAIVLGAAFGALFADEGFRSSFGRLYEELSGGLPELSTAGDGGAGEADALAFDKGAVIAAVLDTIEDVVLRAGGVFVVTVLFFGWWFGARLSVFRERLAGQSRLASSEAEPTEPQDFRTVVSVEKSGVATPPEELSRIVLPSFMVWFFLVSWASVLAVARFASESVIANAIAWNLALVASALYFIQGSGIVSHIRRNSPVARILVPCVALTVLSFGALAEDGSLSVALFALFGLVSLIGVTETWIPYRNAKGVAS